MPSPREIYYCHGCGRVGESAEDLLRQGCEGTHEPYIKADITLDLYNALLTIRNQRSKVSGWVERIIIANVAIKKFEDAMQNE